MMRHRGSGYLGERASRAALPIPAVSALDCVQALKLAGFHLVGRDSGIVYLRRSDGPSAVLAIPDERVLSFDQLEKLLQDAGLSQMRFLELLDRLDGSG